MYLGPTLLQVLCSIEVEVGHLFSDEPQLFFISHLQTFI